jgi:1-acyl-sn-glycerol-3-phosphate acyltransferase
VLDDNGVRPPIIAAGINLFGGPLGLIHRHVTGAIPIRRNTRDPAYLMTLKAYVSELLRTHDFFFYPEGGRSYSGEMKIPKTGLMHAALQAKHPHMVIVPTAVSYDLVLEDHVLARQQVKRSQRPFSRELAELVRYAVGYRSRAFVTFGTPISASGIDPDSRRAVLDLSHAVMKAVGRLCKVLPIPLVAAAMRPSITRRDLEARASALIDTLGTIGANLGVTNGAEAVAEAIEPLAARGIVALDRGRVRVRNRNVLRYYASWPLPRAARTSGDRGAQAPCSPCSLAAPGSRNSRPGTACATTASPAVSSPERQSRRRSTWHGCCSRAGSTWRSTISGRVSRRSPKRAPRRANTCG